MPRTQIDDPLPTANSADSATDAPEVTADLSVPVDSEPIPRDARIPVAAVQTEDPTDHASRKRMWIWIAVGAGVLAIIGFVGYSSLANNTIAATVPSSSMEDTLQIDDQVFFDRRDTDVGRGDIIAFMDPLDRSSFDETGTFFIKRVIGLPGDVVEARNGDLLINEAIQIEPYRKRPLVPMSDFGPVQVGPGQLFVMGDNRLASLDSRFFGTISHDLVLGSLID